ncbi:PIN domain-containing protein [Methylomicrobium sp. RS1]|uniref:PIN domain-containing protein n=1 Tax=Candidatus Methylomicrobium oryzae TaxID=2802053 RepID=UPI001920BBB1|nr:PIN domain-containing protein [Methylomicrobium sp. RS1]MBL1265868.1 PIN domain-containing protein [Methylomicrobium sp. RS1]
MALPIRAQIVDIRSDSPKDTDCFLVDTNAWYWLYYSRASQTPCAPQSYQLTHYPSYIQRTIKVKASLYCCALNFSELAHNIEKAEREIYADIANKTINSKEFRHCYPNQRRKIVAAIKDIWEDVLSVSSMLDIDLNASFINSALSLFPSVEVDGYDLFMAETALQQSIAQIITDDGDYASVPGITIFTANEQVIQKAQASGKLLHR